VINQPALKSRDVPLGSDALLRITAVCDPTGVRLELRVWRASPADRSDDRFRPTGEAITLPIAALKPFQLALAKVGVAALELEFRRPWPREDTP